MPPKSPNSGGLSIKKYSMTIIFLNSTHLETLNLSPISDRIEQWLLESTGWQYGG